MTAKDVILRALTARRALLVEELAEIDAYLQPKRTPIKKAQTVRKKGRTMSAANRAAVSKRMKAYWVARRKQR